MSLVKVCPNCKWEYPATYTYNNCRFCKTEFNMRTCPQCGEFKPMSEFIRGSNGHIQSYCRTCKTAQWKADDTRQKKDTRMARFVTKERDACDALFKDWLARSTIAYKPMTEQQWLEACNHFNGCALCDNDHIEVRQYFINFKDGGMYTAWNMYPICGKCATRIRLIANPFMWLNRRLGYAWCTEERGNKLIKYLESRLPNE